MFISLTGMAGRRRAAQRGRRVLALMACAVLAVSAPVFAAAGPAAAADYGHICNSIATDDVSTATTVDYREAVQCIDYNTFLNSVGVPAIQALATGLCQTKPLGTPVRCAGIQQTVSITGPGITPAQTTQTYACGRFDYSEQCPVGRFYGYSAGAACEVGFRYYANVTTLVVMPITANEYTFHYQVYLLGNQSVCSSA